MLKRILKSVADFFKSPTMHSNLEAFIVSRNPQNAGDVDRLEREFMRRMSSFSSRYY